MNGCTREFFLSRLKNLLFETWETGDHSGEGVKRCLRLLFLANENRKNIVSNDEIMEFVENAMNEYNAGLEGK